MAGGDLAVPVERQPHELQLAAHGGDVLVGPARRVDAALHGGVLRRQAEGVPAHGVQHVEAFGPLIARHNVADGVVAHVAHVRSEEHTSELQSLMRISYAVFCLKKKKAKIEGTN